MDELELVRTWRRLELEAAAHLAAAVDQARDNGYSWAEIARELGITKQGARQRFFTGARELV